MFNHSLFEVHSPQARPVPRTKFGQPRALAAALVALPLLCFAGGAWAQSADMVLAQQNVTPDPVPAGGTASIAITLNNNGPGAASNVKLTDTIPPGSTFVSLTASEADSCTTTPPYQCTWASIPSGAGRTATLKVILPTATTWTNVAAVTADTPDSNPGNNSLTRVITATAAADLVLSATSSTGGASVAAGTPYSYTLTVKNAGPNPLPGGQTPKVEFKVPAGSSIITRPTGTGWNCQPSSGYPRSAPVGTPGDTITCTRDGTDTLAVGADFPPITVNAVANNVGTVAATFDVASTFPDGNTANNTTTVNQPVSAGTDMKITKSAALAPGGGGTQATFTLQARQEGGAPPTGVKVTDTLPAGMTYVSHSGASPWACDFGTTTADTLTCTYPGTYNGGAFTDLPPITLVTQVTGLGDIPNTGHITATPPDPAPDNNESTVTVNNSADLRITKSSSFSPVVVNQPYQWRIDVRNFGPMPVLNGQTITVTDSVPAGVTLNSVAGSGWSCGTLPVTGPGSVTCTHTRASNLAVGSDAPRLTFNAVNTAAGTLTNNACLGTDNTGINGALTGPGPTEPGGPQRNCHDTGILGTTGPNSADLEITKIASPNPVVVGQPLTYLLTVRNLSATVDATDVQVTDVVGSLLSSATAPGLVSVTPSQGTCTPAAPDNASSANVQCSLGTLNAGATATIQIVVRPNNTTAATLARSNTATVNSLTVGDTDRDNNRVTISSDVLPRVEAVVTKTVNPPANVRVGQPMTYTITAKNEGPSTANELVITDVMPPNTAFISAGTPSNGGTCGTLPAVGAGGTLSCSWANVEPGAQRTVTFRARPLAAALDTNVENTVNVAVGANDTELDPNNNTAKATTNVIDSLVDILVQKTDSVDPVNLGDETTYTVTIRNAGPSVGTNLVMTDTFPISGNTARFSYQGNLTATVAGAPVATPDCTEPAIGAMTGTLQCTFPIIGVGAAEEVVLTYRMRAESIIEPGAYSGTQGNYVVVKVDENETEMDNNVVEEDTTTRRAAPTGGAIDLGLTKTTSRDRALPGTEFDYLLTVTNHEAAGSGRDVVPANGAQVTDTLPMGLTFISAAGCSYAADTRQVTCVVPNLAAGASMDFALRVRVDSPYTGPGSVSNTACIDMPGDPNGSNDCSTVPKNVGNPPPSSIPTLSEWGLILLSLMMAGFALRRVGVQSRR